MQGIGIWLGQFNGSSRQIATGITDGCLNLKHEDGPVSAMSEPVIRLPEDAARALCDALVAHFDGASDIRTVRAELDQEKRRVDTLIDQLVKMAGGRDAAAVA